MKSILVKVFLLFGLFAGTCVAAENLSAASVQENLVKAHTKAFMQGNLLSRGVSQEGRNAWDEATNKVAKFVGAVVEAKRILPLSRANIELLEEGSTNNAHDGEALIKRIGNLREVNYDFKPEKYKEINIDLVKKQVAEFVERALDKLKELQKKLEPKFSDFADTKEAKKILQQQALMLEVTYGKLLKDFQEIAREYSRSKK